MLPPRPLPPVLVLVYVYLYLCLQAAFLADGQTWSILPSTVLLRDTGSGQNYSFECRSDPPSKLQLRWVVRRGNFPSQAIVTSGEQNQFLRLTNVMYEMRFVPRFDIRCWQDTRLVAIAEVTVDENECRQDDYCSSLGISNAVCSDVVGGANCSCMEGFQNTTCVDIDECSPTGGHNCSRSASCTNLPGTFSCQCIDGFTGDGHVCADVDECAAGLHNCPPLQECVNTKGTHSCVPMFGSGTDLNPTTVLDIDECSLGLHNCPTNTTQCVNTDGAFSCVCAAGYTGNGRKCFNISQCRTIAIGCRCRNGTVLLGSSCEGVSEQSANSNSLPIGIGVAVGVLALLALVIGLIYLRGRRNRSHNVTDSRGKATSTSSTEGLVFANPDYETNVRIEGVLSAKKSSATPGGVKNGTHALGLNNGALHAGHRAQPYYEHGACPRSSAASESSTHLHTADVPRPSNTGAREPAKDDGAQRLNAIDTSTSVYWQATFASTSTASEPTAEDRSSPVYRILECLQPPRAIDSGDIDSGYMSISRVEPNEYERPIPTRPSLQLSATATANTM